MAEPNNYYTEDRTARFRIYGNRLKEAILKEKNGFNLSIDAPWGAGKTYFISMWEKELRAEANLKVISFNAFDHDLEGVPFIPLAGEFLSIVDKDKEDDFKSRLGEAGKHLLLSFGKNLINLASASLINQEDINALHGIMEKQRASSIIKQIEEYQTRKNDFANFKEILEASIGDSKVVFIIDELDRCSPKTTIQIFECVSQFFSCRNIFFVFAINSSELKHTIKKHYGEGYDADTYLNKMIQHHTQLPYSRSGTIRMFFLFDLLRCRETHVSPRYKKFVTRVICENDCSFRDVQQIATTIMLSDSTNICNGEDLPIAAVYLAACMVKNRAIFQNSPSDIYKQFTTFLGNDYADVQYDLSSFTEVFTSIKKGYYDR